MEDDIFIKKVDIICKEFLCSFPLLNFNWQDIFNTHLSENQQEYLLNRTVNSELVLKYPLQINYQKLFLKQIIDRLETSQTQTQAEEESVIHDEVYSAYGRLVAAGGASDENYKHYNLGHKVDEIITLKESNHLISEGTTGLRTWQASLALSEWIIQNKILFKNTTILELGSGIGLTGLVLEKICKPKHIYLTDCHEKVLNNLCDNVKMNVLKESEDRKQTNSRSNFNGTNLEERCLFSNTDLANISVLNLPWEEFDADICKDLGGIETVIAADIVYDRDLFKPLLNAIKCLKEFSGVQEFIFSCTERNSETLEEFLVLIGHIFQHIEQTGTPEQSVFLWPNDTPVKIYKFKD